MCGAEPDARGRPIWRTIVASKRQIDANRQNARKSTGPRTKKGKAITRLNALKHGLTAQDVLLSGENERAFEELCERLKIELCPEGVLESQLVERVAIALWRLRRVYRVEAGIFASQASFMGRNLAMPDLDKNASTELIKRLKSVLERRAQPVLFKHNRPILDIREDVTSEPGQEPAGSPAISTRETVIEQEQPRLGLAFVEDADGANALTKLSRYEAGLERGLYRALHELQRLQAARKGGVATSLAVDLTIDAG